MGLDSIPLWIFFVGTIVIVMTFIEVGYALGKAAHRKSSEEKETPVSGVSGAVLGLAAFLMAFTFALVAERYDTRKGLVREDANAIRTAYLRTAFLPEPERSDSRRLLGLYLDSRLAFARMDSRQLQDVGPLLAGTDRMQRQLWDAAVANAGRDMNSDVAALYLESLNDMFAVHTSRLAIGVRTRIPIGIWVVLYSLTILGMISMGYHAGIAGSKRSKATWIVAIAFGMVIVLIASLDRPGGFIKVTQQPLVDLQAFMAAEREGGAPPR